MAKKTASLLPATSNLLHQLGDRLRLARLRRRLTAKQVAERAGMAPMTLRSLERGGSGVTIGAYMAVMQVLGVERDLDLILQSDPLGRSLQDARLPAHTQAAQAASIREADAGSQEDVRSLFDAMPSEQVRSAINALPTAQIRKALQTLPSEQVRKTLLALPTQEARKALKALPTEQARRVLSALPSEHMRRVLDALPAEQVREALDTPRNESPPLQADSKRSAPLAKEAHPPEPTSSDWVNADGFTSSQSLAELLEPNPPAQKQRR
jgi:transcriptional regulator with XRE-family HTH domain